MRLKLSFMIRFNLFIIHNILVFRLSHVQTYIVEIIIFVYCFLFFFLCLPGSKDRCSNPGSIGSINGPNNHKYTNRYLNPLYSKARVIQICTYKSVGRLLRCAAYW